MKKSLLLFVFLDLLLPPILFAKVTVTPASGGTSLTPSDTSTNGWVSLGPISIIEGPGNPNRGDFSSGGTLILTAPANWRFRVDSGSVVVQVAKGNGTSDLSNASIIVLDTILVISFYVNGTLERDKMTISGIEVQPIDSLGSNLGSILRTGGTAVVSGIAVSDNVNFGTLSFAEFFPVELTSFSASTNNMKINLNWSTATEIQNYGFDVERKITPLKRQDLLGWEKIGFVMGSGNSNSPKDYSFIDKSVSAPGTYSYRLKQINTDGSFDYSTAIQVEVNKKIEFKLKQNYPNPFNPITKIKYSIPLDALVELKVYNIIGEEIALLQREFKNAGEHEIIFNGEDLSSGIYLYYLKAKLENGEEFSSFNKMTLLK